MNRLSISILICFLTIQTYSATSDDPIQIVRQLYQTFAWEAILAPSELDNATFIDQPRNILEKYLDSNLAYLIIKDRNCSKTEKGICNLDFCPLWASQDPAARDLEISNDKTIGAVKVSFIYPGNNQKINIQYKLVKTTKGWQITDIVYEDGSSLLDILNQ
jgi:hypothetical protein